MDYIQQCFRHQWNIAQLTDGTSICEGDVSVETLTKAWIQVIQEHSILQSTLVSTMEGVYQICFSKVQVELVSLK